MKRILFVYNPRAGRGEIRDSLSYILEELGRTGAELVVHPTTAAQDAMRRVRDYGSSFDMIVCSGGDGTLDEVVTGLMEGHISCPVGYIPAGSTNDYASSLGIPRQMRQAARAIVNGQVFHCDVGRLNQSYFVYVAAFGAFVDVSYSTPQNLKNNLGHLAYILKGMQSLSTIKSVHMQYTSKEASGEGNCLLGMVTNSNSVGGFKGITGSDVTLNDGVFEVTLVMQPQNPLEWPQMLNAMMNGDENRNLITFKTEAVDFHFDERVNWTRDGEFGGEHTDVRIETIPGALPIIVSEPAALEADPNAGDEEYGQG